MSDTPRTDAALNGHSYRMGVEPWKTSVDSDFARQLERELAAEKAQVEIHKSFCEDAFTLCEDVGIGSNIIAKMKQLRAAALSASQNLK
jgi:hypothetical protein